MICLMLNQNIEIYAKSNGIQVYIFIQSHSFVVVFLWLIHIDFL